MTRLLFNPTLEDFTITVDQYGEHPETHTLKASEMKRFEDHVATIMKTKMIDRMLWKDYPKNHNRDQKIKELSETIEIPENGNSKNI